MLPVEIGSVLNPAHSLRYNGMSSKKQIYHPLSIERPISCQVFYMSNQVFSQTPAKISPWHDFFFLRCDSLDRFIDFPLYYFPGDAKNRKMMRIHQEGRLFNCGGVQLNAPRSSHVMHKIVFRFFVFLGVILPGWSIAQTFSADSSLRQLVYLNIPAYRLSVYTQYPDGHWERLALNVGVGKGPQRKYQTPTGQGELYAKATGVTFEYGPQNPEELVGKTITHSNTFDKNTLKPITIRMPNDMKSIFMKITSDLDRQFYTQFVVHETTDWYTTGTPSSNGCIRVEREDMQRLYALIAPSVQEGDFPGTIPIISYYDVAEYYPDQQMVQLHANVYDRQIDYVYEVLRDLQEAGVNTQLMNMPALTTIVRQAEIQFEQARANIRDRLRKAPFHRLIHAEEKQLLHFTFYLRFQY